MECDCDVNQQTRRLYCNTSKLRSKFSRCPFTMKNLLFKSHRTLHNLKVFMTVTFRRPIAIKSKINRLRDAYNNAYKILQSLDKCTSARAQANWNIITFDALSRKANFLCLERCNSTTNVWINSIINSDCLHKSKLYSHHSLFVY